MSKIFFLSLSFFLIIGCQQREVVYDPFIDTFRYKPETEWDYLYLLEKPVTETKIAEK